MNVVGKGWKGKDGRLKGERERERKKIMWEGERKSEGLDKREEYVKLDGEKEALKVDVERGGSKGMK